MSAPTTNPRARMPCMAYRGRPGEKGRNSGRYRVPVVPMPVYQAEAAPEAEAAPRANVRFVLPVRGGHLDPDYEADCCPVWTDLGTPRRVNRLRAWLRRVRKSLSCFN